MYVALLGVCYHFDITSITPKMAEVQKHSEECFPLLPIGKWGHNGHKPLQFRSPKTTWVSIKRPPGKPYSHIHISIYLSIYLSIYVYIYIYFQSPPSSGLPSGKMNNLNNQTWNTSFFSPRYSVLGTKNRQKKTRGFRSMIPAIGGLFWGEAQQLPGSLWSTGPDPTMRAPQWCESWLTPWIL